MAHHALMYTYKCVCGCIRLSLSLFLPSFLPSSSFLSSFMIFCSFFLYVFLSFIIFFFTFDFFGFHFSCFLYFSLFLYFFLCFLFLSFSPSVLLSHSFSLRRNNTNVKSACGNTYQTQSMCASHRTCFPTKQTSSAHAAWVSINKNFIWTFFIFFSYIHPHLDTLSTSKSWQAMGL